MLHEALNAPIYNFVFMGAIARETESSFSVKP